MKLSGTQTFSLFLSKPSLACGFHCQGYQRAAGDPANMDNNCMLSHIVSLLFSSVLPRRFFNDWVEQSFNLGLRSYTESRSDPQ